MKRFPSLVLSNRSLPMLRDHFVENYLYIVSSQNTVSVGGLEFWGFQGCGVFDKSFVDSTQSLCDAWLTSSIDSGFENAFGHHFRGAGIAYVRDQRSNYFYILPDLLGEAILYKYEFDDVVIISGDLLEIERITRLINAPLTKSLDYSLELTIASNGGLNKSTYVEVTSFDIFEYLIVSSRNINVKKYKDSRDFFDSKEEYSSLLEKAADEIRANVAAAANNHDHRHVAHLTGGFDSRLVLAAAQASGVADKFVFYCEGDPVHEDTKIAESAAARVGATMTLDVGTPAAFAPQDFGGKMLGPLLVSSGMLAIGPHRGHRETSLTLLSGGYGETFRSFYGARIGPVESNQTLTAETFGNKIWSPYLFSTDGSGLFSANFIDDLSLKLESELDKGRKLGVKEDDLSDFLYLQLRNRYFVGIITSNWNRLVNRFDPLYSPSGVKLAFKLSLQERMDNIVGYDLMHILCPELLDVPFDSKKFGDSVTRERGYSDPVDYNFVRPKFDKRAKPVVDAIDTRVLPIPAVTQDDIAYAKKINARASQIAGRAHVRDVVNRILRRYTSAELATRFNSEELALLRMRPANTRIRIRTLYSLFGALAWLADDVDLGRVSLNP
ncbi:hypothetical protein OIU93_07300 [Paeniglutamicibacter sp. ZC-3]|uniref:hypothetical protein n=1 Tax=Paeniglutamicibacter sp. ZC-3 TaxID=2986919 RepID=UPI0021F6D5E7|nr:hypothetical protein [Paeniglutamicibacter sp. ZC-3]MCV9994105.1 hypothetical protein [Paeniglutamicibacter sp. ZC-3]